VTVLDPADKRALAAELLRRKAQRSRPVPLSAAQYRLWLLSELEPETPDYNVPVAFRLRGALDRAALQRALTAIARRHDVLRARITTVDGEPAYAVAENVGVALPVADAGDPAECAQLLARESARPFDLRADVPLRALLVRCAAAEHVLLVTMHHIAVDGWSVGIFTRELSALYAAYAADETSPLAEPACTYADFAAWQRDAAGDRAQTENLRFWTAALTDPPPPLPFAALSDGTVSAGGGLRARTLGASLHGALDRFCRARGTTLYATLLAAFAVLLERLTDRDDFIVGAAVANRTLPAFEEPIGFFVNTLPLRLRLTGEPDFATWLAEVQGLTLDAFDHQDVALQAVVEAVQPARVAGRTPLINVMFVVNNTPGEPLTLRGLDVTPVDIERTTAKFDLTLEATPLDDDTRIAFEYRTELFTTAAVDALLDAVVTLLGAAIADPHQRVSSLPVVPPDALDRQLHAWNATTQPLCGERIEALFERRARAQPAAVAIVDGANTMTYGELDARAAALARQIRARGSGPGAGIGMCFERGVNAIVAMLAILKAGGVYVPFEPAYPAARSAQMLAVADVRLVLTEQRWCARFANRCDVLAYDGADIAPHDVDVIPPVPGSGADAAYIMFTSGSTGPPKGVLVPHAGIERLVVDAAYAPITPADTLAHAATLAFDAATFEIWGALLNGARLAIVPAAVLLAPGGVRAAIGRDGITVQFMTPAFARELARSDPAAVAPLRRLIIGGDVLDVATVARLQSAAPRTQLVNGYGPTETTTFATTHAIDVLAPGTRAIPIGRPIRNTRAYILDRRRRPLPAGAPGELWIGGAGVALGYVNDAELTARKFRCDPFDGRPGARMYATGDRVRFLPDGSIAFLGRIDRQIKRNGFRIEPGEIEAALAADPAVSAAAVVVRGDGSSRARLAAYVATADPDGGAIAQRLRALLPAFMQPDTIVALAALPVDVNGKVDRRALAAHAEPAAPRAAAELADEAEAALRAVWEELLGVRPIANDENFFALGGHSLLAMRMLAEVERRYAVRLTAALLFEEPTIAHLARAMRDGAVRRAHHGPDAFNAAGARRTLFFFHGSIRGGGFYCRELATALGPDRPLIAIRPHAVRHGPLPAIEAMAADAVALIKRGTPHGPYLLGGYCNGGLVAFEVARQLRARGDDVARVVLIDVPDVAPGVHAAHALLERGGTLLRVDAPLRARLGAQVARLPHHHRRFCASSAKREFIARRIAKLLRVPQLASDAVPDPLLAAWSRLTEAHVPGRYDGRLTLLATRPDSPADGARGHSWIGRAPHVDIRPIPGRHLTCLTEHLADTAATFAAVLASEL
jgi:amino acid adenylation domain-containing protein